MPTRFIKESCRSSKNLDQVTDFEERLFWRMLTTADDFGRFQACPELVRSACFPRRDRLSIQKISEALSGLQSQHLILLYTVKDRQYGQFCTFEEHQGKARARKSKYPAQLDTFLQADASRCVQVHADVPGHPDTDTDLSSLNSSLNSSESEFEQFWKAYPRRSGGKKNAWKAWGKATDKPPLADLLSAIDRAKQTEQWKRDGGQYIPYPATWINRGMWDDDIRPMESPFMRGMTSFLERHREEAV